MDEKRLERKRYFKQLMQVMGDHPIRLIKNRLL